MRLPPANLDAEAAVLSAVMLDPSRLAAVRPILPPAAFRSRANHLIYEAIGDLAEHGRVIDLVTVADRLREKRR